MSIAKFLVLFAFFAIFLACGEVGGGFEDRPGFSSSQNCAGENCHSSSSMANSSSSFDIGLDWKPAPDSSYVHGATQITIDAYYISKDLITQKQYKAVMGGENPSKGVKNDSLPVEGVDWFKAGEFCKKLSHLMDLDSNAVKLPTEAEWEYVAFPGVIQRNADYWEWTNDCWDNNFPYEQNNPSGPPNCLELDYKVRKGFAKRIDERYATEPNLKDIGGGYISFRVVLKKNF
ncbi:hypothetical protein R83H12_01873 [Fibrobacteria bacterium R8-3-H12]